MAETEVDRRARRLVLVSHSLLTPAPTADVSTAMVGWAHTNDWGIHQLPEPLHLIDPRAAGTPDGAEEDRNLLDAVFQQLRVYLDHDYTLVGIVWHEREVAGDAGRLWSDHVAASAAAAGVPLGSAWLIPADGHFPPAPLEAVR